MIGNFSLVRSRNWVLHTWLVYDWTLFWYTYIYKKPYLATLFYLISFKLYQNLSKSVTSPHAPQPASLIRDGHGWNNSATISYHVQPFDWIPLSNVIFLPKCQKVKNAHNNAILLVKCTLISALYRHICKIQKWVKSLHFFMCIKQLWNTAAYLYKKMLPRARAR